MCDQPQFTREQVRNVDRIAIEELGLPGIALMENAGRGATEFLLRQSNVQRIAVCAAGGNNGGDGFVIARHLMLAGCDVDIRLFSPAEQLSGDALINYQVASRLGISITECHPEDVDESLEQTLEAADWIVDALFGTGLSSEVRPPFAKLIDRINAIETPVLAVDLPSGLDCDTGQPLGTAIRAVKTVTFVAHKVGFSQPGASDWTGDIEVVSIGVPWNLGLT